MANQCENGKILRKDRGHPVSKRLEDASLKDVPLEERRKEASKPLFLVRYE
ncbi:hypothetical protein IMZ68_07780 [Candidatus Bathyarchaeota archaeon]|nr:hypothetical protein [Candidatus Bathyarchaeota archaeon]